MGNSADVGPQELVTDAMAFRGMETENAESRLWDKTIKGVIGINKESRGTGDKRGGKEIDTAQTHRKTRTYVFRKARRGIGSFTGSGKIRAKASRRRREGIEFGCTVRAGGRSVD